jgi:hypothetical protein
MGIIKSFEEYFLYENENAAMKTAEEIVKNSTPATAEADLKQLQELKSHVKDPIENDAWVKLIEKFLEGPGKNLKAE